MGRIIRGALVGFLFTLTVGVWPAGANVSGVSVTNPSPSGEVMAGSYSADGTPSGFNVSIRGVATTDCSSGWASGSFTVTGPSGYSKVFTLNPASSSGTWSPASTWATEDLKNGVYTVNFQVREVQKSLNLGNCAGQSGQDDKTAKLANPPKKPEWQGSPSAASDGSAHVTIQWKKNGEPDIVAYQIVRSGPDGTRTAVVAPDGCPLSSDVYTCEDVQFSENYSGAYTYKILAQRYAPSGTGEECSPGSSDRCVTSAASETRSVTLTKPTPTPSPSPTDSPSGDPTTNPSPGGSPTVGVRGLPGTGKGGSGTSVLSFGGSSGGGSSFNDFYSGTYDKNLPYQPKTLIVGDGTSTPGSQVEAAAVSDLAPNYRTIMLPVAGGLLAFLSAAHVRRLLVHF
jgi:hypothetical protein